MKKQIISCAAAALAFVGFAGCEKTNIEYVTKPTTMTVGEVVECELNPALPEPGDNLYVNGYRCPILPTGEAGFHNIPGAEQYVVHTQEAVMVEGTKVGFGIPSTQTYREGGLSKAACPLYALTDNAGLAHIVFKPAVGALKIVIPPSGEEAFKEISSVEITCKAYVLTSDLQVDAATDETYILGNATQKLTVNGTINILNGAEVYCAMPPMRFLEDLTVKLVNEKVTQTLPLKVQGQYIERGKALAVAVEPQWKVLTPYYGSANCIVVAPGSTEVEFDCAPHTSESLTYAYTKNDKGELLPPADEAAQPLASKAEVLWNDVSKDFITGVQLTNGKKSIKAKLSGEKGNALVAIRDTKGNILWSFHIWVTGIADHDYGNGYTVMDRNLGAVSIVPGTYQANSLLYQWGRKDPFPSGDASASASASHKLYKESGETSLETAVASNSTNGTVAYAVAHPTTYIKYKSKSSSGNYIGNDWMIVYNDALWGNPTGFDNPDPSTIKKSVYDPCPEGYMVAPNDVWWKAGSETSIFPAEAEFGAGEGWVEVNKNKGLLVTINGNCTFYPASGIYNRSNGNLQDIGVDGSTQKSCPIKTKSNSGYIIVKGKKPDVAKKGNARGNAYCVRCVKER